MALFKCKMCGGNVELAEDKTFGTCEYCGSSMTFPKMNDEQRTAAFNRGNHFRRIGEFDKALDIYEQIVREDETDAEAHWCCALCRFGVEYVEDPNSMEYIPTCHRVSFDNFLEDVDYLAALEYSDGITKRQYQKDGAKIAEVQRGILAASQKEKPFDVFLCYKETDENGQRTKDSVLAQDVYYQLTDLGYRVFFSRITLEDVAGKQYEPYIFAALNSAKVMVVIGTKPEYMNAAWVKNEWSRFLAMVKKDHSKLLLPCYRDMAPYEMPESLSVLQSYDMGKIGFLQDLIRGIKKVLDEPQKPVPVIAKTEDRQEKRQNYVALLLIALIFVSIVAIGAILWAAGVFDARQPGEEVLPTPLSTTLPEEIPCESLAVSAKRYLLQSIGDTEAITCVILPANSTEVISFRSEDTTVATVDGNGTITAVNNGTTNIIITCGKVTIACEVIVGDGRASAAVPLLIGKDIQEANDILQEKGFPEPRINKVYSSQPADTVVDQNPSANTVVSTETVVVLDVSKGPKPVETAPPTPKPTPERTSAPLPLLVGKDIQEANAILQEKGFPEPVVTEVYNSQAAGTVLNQNPSSGTVVSTETVVVLDVSKGPKPTPEPTPAAELVAWDVLGPLYYKNDRTLEVGESITLYLGSADGTGGRITVNWTCKQNDYITVSGNKITAVKSTNMNPITISTVYEGKTYTCIIRTTRIE